MFGRLKAGLACLLILCAVGSVLAGCGGASQQAEQNLQAYNDWVAYWNDGIQVMDEFDRDYARADKKADKEKAAVNRFMILCSLLSRCCHYAARDLANGSPPPDALSAAHREFIKAMRTSERTFKKSALQIAEVLDNPDPTYALFGEGSKTIKRATNAATRAEKDVNRAILDWKNAVHEEGTRLKTEM